MFGITPAFVLYTHDMTAARRFYETVGLSFVEERHGDGPMHFACDLGGVVLEIYPIRAGTPVPKPYNGMALIFFVGDFNRTLSELKDMSFEPKGAGIYDEGRGLRAASVRDPDERLVRLLERDPDVVQ